MSLVALPVHAAEAQELPAPSWLPAGKVAAVCFSVDDIHPGTSADRYEAGGDLSSGALGRLVQLLDRHPQLRATLCVTPDWRLDSLAPAAGLLRHLPWINRNVHLTQLLPAGQFRLDRHPELVHYLNQLQRCELVLHGLMHTHVGPEFAVEFQHQTEAECLAAVQRGLEIFRCAGVKSVPGFAPPGWNAPDALVTALSRMGFHFLLSARDVRTPITPQAVSTMSGRRDVSLIYPQFIGPGRLVHISCNFQATSAFERAEQILSYGGVLHIKAHIFKTDGHHYMQDGLDELYCNYLDLLFTYLERRFGGCLWWARISELADRMRMYA